VAIDLIVLLILCFATASVRAQEPAAHPSWDASIGPLLEARCGKCHGEAKQKSGLRLDGHGRVLVGGERGPAVIPGDPQASLVVRAIRYDDLDLQMPPRERLPQGEIDALTAWVAAGAPGPEAVAGGAGDAGGADAADAGVNDADPHPGGAYNLTDELLAERAAHWSFLPVTDPAAPDVRDTSWVRDEVDAFILAGIEAAELSPAPPAERSRWLRRVAFDLTGLPPSQQMVEAFVTADDEQAAAARVVDELLASDRFGERWARHWLDLMRYAETRGHEFDFTIPNAWQYRDYVIRALNADVPYDQFVSEHVAGDLLVPPRLHPQTGAEESVLGTGFWALGEEVHSPVDIRQDQCDRFANQVDVLSRAFLGLSVACARCHDHKFDPIRASDFYAFQGLRLSSAVRQVRFESRRANMELVEDLAAIDAEGAPLVGAAVARALGEDLRDLQALLDAAAGLLAEVSAEQAATGRSALLAVPGLPLHELDPDGVSDLPRGGDVWPPAMDILFADFESGSWDGWVVEGEAFGERPTLHEEYDAELHARGAAHAQSWMANRDGELAGLDDLTGTLTSPDFVLEREFVHLLVGGGNHSDEVGVRLLVGEEEVARAAGRSAAAMRPVSFDVAAWRGQRARLQAFDQREGGWGHVSFDHVVFSDRPAAEALTSDRPAAEELGWWRACDRVARSRGLDTERLHAWVRALRDGEHGDPLTALRMVAASEDPGQALTSWRDETLAALGAERSVGDDVQTLLDVEGLGWTDDEPASHWRVDGPTFGTGPVRTGALRIGSDPSRPVLSVTERAAARADPAWDVLTLAEGTDLQPGAVSWVQAGRTLRTPTVTLEHGTLWSLVRGRGGAFAVVDGHRLIHGPLHGGTVASFDVPGWRWISHDLGEFVGHRVHVEYSPLGDDSGFALAQVVASEHPPFPAQAVDIAPLHLAAEASAAGRAAPDRSALAARTAQHLRDAVHLLDGPPARWNEPDLVARRLNWLLERPELLSPGVYSGEVLEAFGRYRAWREVLEGLIVAESHTAPALWDGNGVDEQLLVRGSPRSPGDDVPRTWLDALGGDLLASDDGSGRLALARHLTDPDNPLLARVFVNRVWQHLFGRGLVGSPDDFGHMGQAPSHPELLDHLATDFVAQGWSIKTLVRRLVLSATYRQGGEPVSGAREADPTNALWHHVPRRRLDGEILRDAVLSLSGRLDLTAFGPPVSLHLTTFMEGRGRPPDGPVDGDGRRSVYLGVRRNFMSPFFLVFDAPLPASTMGRRSRSNVPAQALTLLNDPFIHGEAARWAEAELSLSRSPESRITVLWSAALCREPEPQELADVLDFLREQGERHGLTDDTWRDDPRPWADLCHVVINLKEFSFPG
jgi:hypothetical protein